MDRQNPLIKIDGHDIDMDSRPIHTPYVHTWGCVLNRLVVAVFLQRIERSGWRYAQGFGDEHTWYPGTRVCIRVPLVCPGLRDNCDVYEDPSSRVHPVRCRLRVPGSQYKCTRSLRVVRRSSLISYLYPCTRVPFGT
jgi:hypothetical protein